MNFVVCRVLLLGCVLMLGGVLGLVGFSTSGLLLEWEMGSLVGCGLEVSLLLDHQSLMMGATVCFIAMNVMEFSAMYMVDDSHQARFNILIVAFVSSMMGLVFVPNLFVVLLGWDGLGLTSFLLVAYYSKSSSLGAAMLTAITNRVGDAFILVSMAVLMCGSHWSSYGLWIDDMGGLSGVLILLAACTKSAQVPFSSWLPAAMAAPTPVSALVHSSTLVTAGVFLLIRFYPFLSECTGFNSTLLIMACTTTLMAGVCATFETDMKKVIALSTLSQLGVMMCSVGIGAPNLALFHLLTHAMFKALLFICAGGVIHFGVHNQDTRGLGSLKTQEIISSCFVVANMALCGVPFLAGFYSKDLILESVWGGYFSGLVTGFMCLSTSFTSVYTARVVGQCLWCPINFSSGHALEEGSMLSPNPIVYLSVGALLGGALLNWIYVGPQIMEFMKMLDKLLPLVLGAMGGVLGWVLLSGVWVGKSTLLGVNADMWFTSPMNSQVMLVCVSVSSYGILSVLDQGWQEVVGSGGLKGALGLVGDYVVSLGYSGISSHVMLSLLGFFAVAGFYLQSSMLWGI